MPYILSNKSGRILLGAAFFAALAIGGCARHAPNLPPDYGSVDTTTPLSADQFTRAELDMTCPAIVDEQVELTAEAKRMTGVIDDSKGYNEAVGILGALFIVPALAADQNPNEKRRLDEIQVRWDRLVAVKRFKSCP